MKFVPNKYEKIVLNFYKFAGRSEKEIGALISRFLLQRKNA